MQKKRAKTLVKGIFLGASLVAGMLCISTISSAVCVNYDTAVEAVYTESYNRVAMDSVQGSPLEAGAADGVDVSTGKLSLLRTDLSLEGMAGMDLALIRYYDSKKANIGKAIAERKSDFAMDTVRVSFATGDGETHEIVVNEAIYEKHADALKDMLVSYEKSGNGNYTTVDDTQQTKLIQSSDYNVYGISTGWAFDFPWIETKTLGTGTTEIPTYLHYGSIGSMRIATDTGNRITGFEDYDYQDVKLEDFDQTVDGIACRYLLRDKTGLRTYFNKDGVVVMKKDNHDNTIKFTYRDKIYFDTITDSVGRNVKFSYTQSAHGLLLLQKITVEGQKVAGGVSKKTVTYQSSETSYTSIRGSKMYGSKLNRVKVDGTEEIYTYKTVESLANTSGAGVASQRAVTNETYLIQGAETEGSIKQYEYRAGAIRSASTDSQQERDVVTQHYYVTREYEQSGKNAKKKANGVKYDYFQQQTDSKNNREFVSYADLDNEHHEMYAYGTDGLQNMTLVSSYNPNKKQKAKKFTDYMFAKDDINTSTLQLKKKPKKSTMVYVFNTNRLPVSETEEVKTKTQTEYTYDQNGRGSLVVLETEKNYGTKRTGKASTSKEGYTYDTYRNILTSKGPKAYRDKYKGKEYLFTVTNTYYGNGYPADDTPYKLCEPKTETFYVNATTIRKMEYILAENQLDISKLCEYINENNTGYRLISQNEERYDNKGNQIETIIYPSCSQGDLGDVITYTYNYNALGQRIKTTVDKTSDRHPEQNQAYIVKEASYDSFGNEISNIDEKGIFSTYSYNEDTSEEAKSVYAKGTIYETTDEEFQSEDSQQTMNLDNYNRCTVTQSDAFGNTLIEKDEREGTWIESDYDYGAEEDESTDEENEEDSDEAAIEPRLIEQRTYAFEPTDEKVFTKEDGTKEYNYDIAGRSDEILSASRYTYDGDNEEIIAAEFSGGSIDAEHCSSWTMSKNEEEIDDEENTIVTSYIKELNPQKYSENVDKENYYNQFDSYVLAETVTTSIDDEEGNRISEITTTTSGNSKQVTKTTSIYDDFGRLMTQTTTNQVSEGSKSKNQSETVTSYEYDYQGNIVKTEVKNRKDTGEPWITTITKATYNDQGQLVESYDAKGTEEGYATKYEYDISGQLTKESIPIDKKGGNVIYQVTTREYDESGNVVVEETEQGDGKVNRTEYTYDSENKLILVKDVESDDKAIYAQYLYDSEGNKIRQYTGLTKPLTLTLKKGKGDNSYSYMDTDYHVEVSGQAKKDIISETKYQYNKKDELISYTDPEGNVESYTYDIYGNLTKTVDKNGNVSRHKYDYQSRLIEEAATDKETEKTVTHTYEYDERGNTSQIDNRRFTYDVLTGQMLSETSEAGKRTLKKIYDYDSDGSTTEFKINVDNETAISYVYKYDGESKLEEVLQKGDNKNETIASYEYDENGALLKENGQKVQTEYSYNLNSTMSHMVNKTKDGVLLSQYDATYNKGGQKIEETEEIRGITGTTERNDSKYTYDMLGRLTKESHTGSEDISYTYDAHNNRKEMRTANQTVSYRYNKNDELERISTLNNKTEEADITLYKYDNNGNQLATVKRKKIDKTKEGTQFDLNVTIGQNQLNDNLVNHYNAFNEQEKVLTKNYKVIYQYNSGGLRESKTVNGKKTIYVWDGDQLAMELDEKGNVMKRYIRGQNLLYTDQGEGTEKQYYVKDTHGSIVQLMNEDGSIKKQYTYDAFGNEEKPDKKDENPFRYCGEYYDKETDTLYLRARSYDASTGRFLTSDTYTGENSKITTLNLYTYCENNAVNMVDPSGHWGVKDGKFVHQDITKEVIKEGYNIIGPSLFAKFCNISNKSKKKKLLDGVILPDFVEDLYKTKLTRKKLEEKYTDTYYHIYHTYKRKRLLGYKLRGKGKKAKEKISNRFHGKSLYLLTKLKNKAKAKVKNGIQAKENKCLFVGCVLHSIQDYSAHSYVLDLADYKKYFDTYRYGETSFLYDKENAYHSDWDYNEKGKLVRNKTTHKDYKDNPDANLVERELYVKEDGVIKRKTFYQWNPNVERANNPRYQQAKRDTQEFLNEVIGSL